MLDANPAAFERLHPEIRRWVWQQGWPELRPIQASAVGPILARDRDVVISAPTAGGKTEAAFLPILTDLAGFEGPGPRCLSVAPLRALINDQTRRLEPICEAVGVTFQPWHGDVSAGKAKFWKRPSNVLMTTPESLEALLMVRGAQFGAVCAGLRFIVVDELHAFFGTARGAQLQSLLARVQAFASAPIPRVALSATLADTSYAGRFLRPEKTLPSEVLSADSAGSEIKLVVKVVPRAAAPPPPPPPLEAEVDDDNAPTGALPAPPRPDDPPPAASDGYVDAIAEITEELFARLRGDSHLVFANSRNRVELIADALRERCESMALPNEFFAHHGALSRELRVSLEERLRAGSLPTTAVCTSTLEMGIDIGDVATIAQVGPAPSVASLKQRVGRSGRRAGQSQVLRQFVIAEPLDSKSHHVDYLRLPLLQAIATVELMIEGRFEPPLEGELHVSTLVQQVLSLMLQNRGGITAAALYEQLCVRGPFAHLGQRRFVQLLRDLGASEVIEQSPDGDLLPGKVGEQLTSHYSFYATFDTPEEYQLFSAGRRLGSLPITEPLVPGQYLLFAGRRWKIVHVDEAAKHVLLDPARGGRPPRFGGEGASQHQIVHERMRELLGSDRIASFLDKRAIEVLAQARAAARIYCAGELPIYETGSDAYLAHWSGTRIGSTLALWLQRHGWSVEALGPLVRVEGARAEDLRQLAADLASSSPPDAGELAAMASNLFEGKHDWTVSRELLGEAFAARHIDVTGARRWLDHVARSAD